MTNEAWENFRCPNCGGYPQHKAGCMTPGAPFFAPIQAIQAQYAVASGTTANTNYTVPPPMQTVAPLPPESEREWLDREIQKVRELARV